MIDRDVRKGLGCPIPALQFLRNPGEAWLCELGGEERKGALFRWLLLQLQRLLVMYSTCAGFEIPAAQFMAEHQTKQEDSRRHPEAAKAGHICAVYRPDVS